MTDDTFIKLMVAFLFFCSNFLWAYSQVITKRLVKVNAIQINLHMGIIFMFGTGIFYPTQVTNPVPI